MTVEALAERLAREFVQGIRQDASSREPQSLWQNTSAAIVLVELAIWKMFLRSLAFRWFWKPQEVADTLLDWFHVKARQFLVQGGFLDDKLDFDVLLKERYTTYYAAIRGKENWTLALSEALFRNCGAESFSGVVARTVWLAHYIVAEKNLALDLQKAVQVTN